MAMCGGGVNEVISGETGFLAKSNNEFVKHTFSLLEHPKLRQSMGNVARKRVEGHFSHIAFTAKLQSVLETVLNLKK